MVIADIQPSTFSPSTVSVLACGSTFSTLPRKTCSFLPAEAAGAAGAACVFGGSVLAGSCPHAVSMTANTAVAMMESRCIRAVYRESLDLLKRTGSGSGFWVLGSTFDVQRVVRRSMIRDEIARPTCPLGLCADCSAQQA